MAAQRHAGESNAYAVSTLYLGNLHPNLTLAHLQDLCLLFGAVEDTKIVRDKTSGASAGYAFVRFADRRAAQAALGALHGQACLGRPLRANWAFQMAPLDDSSLQFNIFVGDLALDVNDAALFDAFRHTDCSQARVLWDHATGRSKRYGFVSFRSRALGDAAIVAMNGEYIGMGRVRCRWAQHKQDESRPPLDVLTLHSADAFNTNVYVGNVPPTWTDLDLWNHFSVFGRLVQARQHKKGGYAFVRFEQHEAAMLAILTMQGATLDGQALKCSWGKTVPAWSEDFAQEVADTLYRTAQTPMAPPLPGHCLSPTASGAHPWPPAAGGALPPWALSAGLATGALPQPPQAQAAATATGRCYSQGGHGTRLLQPPQATGTCGSGILAQQLGWRPSSAGLGSAMVRGSSAGEMPQWHLPEQQPQQTAVARGGRGAALGNGRGGQGGALAMVGELYGAAGLREALSFLSF